MSAETPVEQLHFVQARLPLLAPGPKSNPEKHKLQDRTTTLVKKWSDLKTSIQVSKSSLYGNCKFKSLKGDVVSLLVVDMEHFTKQQEGISSKETELERFEQTIRELDAFGPSMWVNDLESVLAIRDSSISRAERRKSESLARAISQHPGEPVEVALNDAVHLKNVAEFDKMIANSKADLDRLKPIFERMRGLLDSAGC